METEDSINPTNCAICSSLKDKEAAFQKYGWEENDTFLPAAYFQLQEVIDLKPYSSRKLKLLQCPACRTYYLYHSDYEYLVNGSEDEEYLERLTSEEATQYL
ncbi:MAG: hypothetical protein H6667_18685 [Ardenticatenaceae bacterium]|nr:hypothetical protein [Ardenticatenaceae bacterium]MCB9446482.1 hypothetical protein [Ardenticatenaceae bacterium]